MRWPKALAGLALYASLSFAAALEINTATEAQLDSINGIGPAMSSRILEARRAAAFTGWDDLMRRVSGIGAKKAAQFSRQGLTVNGLAFATPEPPQAPADSAH